MKITRNKNGTLTVFTLMDPYIDTWGSWDGSTYGTMTIPDNGTYDVVTAENSPITVKLEKSEDSDLFVARDANGHLILHRGKPVRNSVTPRWSSVSHVHLLSPYKIDFPNSYVKGFCDDDENARLFNHLTWDDEPVRVKIVF